MTFVKCGHDASSDALALNFASHAPFLFVLRSRIHQIFPTPAPNLTIGATNGKGVSLNL